MTDVTALVPERFYNSVGTSAPPNPNEGDTWYDTDSDESKVYDGSVWEVVNITAHGDLSGVGPSDHHARYTDNEAAAAAPVQQSDVPPETPLRDASGGLIWESSPAADTGQATGTLPAYGEWVQMGSVSVDYSGEQFLRLAVSIDSENNYHSFRVRSAANGQVWKVGDPYAPSANWSRSTTIGVMSQTGTDTLYFEISEEETSTSNENWTLQYGRAYQALKSSAIA